MKLLRFWKSVLVLILAMCRLFLPALGRQEEIENLEIYDLDELAIEEIPIEDNIMPTSRPFDSVYGAARSILDTPRNVTIISRAQLDAIAIKDVRDFSRLTSSSYTKTNFGAPATPNLRGQEADLFVNGMRRGGSVNGNGLPINFNAVESVNIVKGPAGVVYGTTNYLGGYADLITKKPFFDGPSGQVSFHICQYDQYTWNLDYGAPIDETSAWRVSYEGKDWDGYWNLWYHRSHALYFAYTYRPNSSYRIETNVEFFKADYTENWGINRVTQDLIDHGRYIPNDQTDEEYATYAATLGNGCGFWCGDPVTDFASQFGGGGFASIIPVASHTVPVDRRWKLAAPGDDSSGKAIYGGVDQFWELSGNLSIVNKTQFGYKDRETFSSYHYSEYLKDNYLLENRTEIHGKGNLMGQVPYEINVGLRLRYDAIWSVNHFFNEPVNFWDMTRDPDLYRVPDQAFSSVGTPYVFGKSPSGILQHWYIGNDEFAPIPTLTGGDSAMLTVGPFFQADLELHQNFSLLFGYTVDRIEGKVKHPTLGSNGSFDYDGDGEIDDDRQERGFQVSDDLDLANYNLSPVVRLNDNTSLYATWNYSETYIAEIGGRPDVPSWGEDRESRLLEFGAKFSLLEDSLFIGAAYVDRSYTELNPDGTIDDVLVDAFEIEFNYQPDRRIYATFSYSYIDQVRTGGFYASPYTIDRALAETGGLYISPLFQGAPAGELIRSPGVPKHLANALFRYQFDNGFGLVASFLGYGNMISGYEGFPIRVPNLSGGDDYQLIANTAELPFQTEVDFSLFWENEAWMVKLSIFNVGDEKNWDVNNAAYGNGSIVPRLPRHGEFTLVRRF